MRVTMAQEEMIAMALGEPQLRLLAGRLDAHRGERARSEHLDGHHGEHDAQHEEVDLKVRG